LVENAKLAIRGINPKERDPVATLGPRYFPGIFMFIGNDPFPPPRSLGDRLERKRLQMGLSYAEAAKLTGVDEGTFLRWVSGEWKPRKTARAAETFLRLPLR
jgi:hypothetical protein